MNKNITIFSAFLASISAIFSSRRRALSSSFGENEKERQCLEKIVEIVIADLLYTFVVSLD